MDDRGADYWRALFRHYARLEVPLAAPYTVYFRESGPRTNEMQLSYVEGAQTSRDVVKTVAHDIEEYLFCPPDSGSVFYLRLSK